MEYVEVCRLIKSGEGVGTRWGRWGSVSGSLPFLPAGVPSPFPTPVPTPSPPKRLCNILIIFSFPTFPTFPTMFCIYRKNKIRVYFINL